MIARSPPRVRSPASRHLRRGYHHPAATSSFHQLLGGYLLTFLGRPGGSFSLPNSVRSARQLRPQLPRFCHPSPHWPPFPGPWITKARPAASLRSLHHRPFLLHQDPASPRRPFPHFALTSTSDLPRATPSPSARPLFGSQSCKGALGDPAPRS